MNYFVLMAQANALLFLFLLLGVVIKRLGVVTDDGQKGILSLSLNVALPAMIFMSFDMPVTPELLRNGGLAILLGAIVKITMFFLGKLLWGKKAPFARQAVLRACVLIPNTGMAGLPLVYAVFGQEALFYAALYMVPQRFTTWSLGVSLFRPKGSKSAIRDLLLNPGIAAVWAGLIYMLLPVHLPAFLLEGIDVIGATAAPLAIISVGCILAEVNIKTALEKDVLFLTAIRLLAIPLLVFLAFSPFSIPPTLLVSAVILSAMPVGLNVVLFAKQWDGDYVFAAKCLFVSSVLSLLSLPLLTLLF